MQPQRFFVGLARAGVEISAPGYRRPELVLTFDSACGYYINATAVEFAPALAAYGFIDGLALSGSLDGPLIAVSPLLIPIHIGAGVAFCSPPGLIGMNQKSIDAIRSIAPIAIAS